MSKQSYNNNEMIRRQLGDTGDEARASLSCCPILEFHRERSLGFGWPSEVTGSENGGTPGATAVSINLSVGGVGFEASGYVWFRMGAGGSGTCVRKATKEP